jgi:hypothetical protein
MAEILWHRRETRRQTEKTNIRLNGGEAPAYSPTLRYPHKSAPGRSLGEQPIMVTRDPLIQRPDGVD